MLKKHNHYLINKFSLLSGDIIFNAQYPELPPDFIFGEDAEFLPEPSELPVSKVSICCSQNEYFIVTVSAEVCMKHHFGFAFFNLFKSDLWKSKALILTFYFASSNVLTCCFSFEFDHFCEIVIHQKTNPNRTNGP